MSDSDKDEIPEHLRGLTGMDLVRRVLEELEGEEKIYLFTRRPPEEFPEDRGRYRR